MRRKGFATEWLSTQSNGLYSSLPPNSSRLPFSILRFRCLLIISQSSSSSFYIPSVISFWSENSPLFIRHCSRSQCYSQNRLLESAWSCRSTSSRRPLLSSFQLQTVSWQMGFPSSYSFSRERVARVSRDLRLDSSLPSKSSILREGWQARLRMSDMRLQLAQSSVSLQKQLTASREVRLLRLTQRTRRLIRPTPRSRRDYRLESAMFSSTRLGSSECRSSRSPLLKSNLSSTLLTRWKSGSVIPVTSSSVCTEHQWRIVRSWYILQLSGMRTSVSSSSLSAFPSVGSLFQESLQVQKKLPLAWCRAFYDCFLKISLGFEQVVDSIVFYKSPYFSSLGWIYLASGKFFTNLKLGHLSSGRPESLPNVWRFGLLKEVRGRTSSSEGGFKSRAAEQLRVRAGPCSKASVVGLISLDSNLRRDSFCITICYNVLIAFAFRQLGKKPSCDQAERG